MIMRHDRAIFMLSAVIAGTLSSCASSKRVLIWDTPSYRSWAVGTSSDERTFVPPRGMPEDFARSGYRQAHMLAMEIYSHRLQPSDPSSLIDVIDSLSSGKLMEDPIIREAIEQYARTGVFITRWADDPIAARAHLALDERASRGEGVWTHQKSAENTAETVTSFRLRQKSMPVYVPN
ncbi:MAG: hypothetical protein ACK5Q4_11665 [Phycisphaerae bacterium]|jgi:hypothetical protein